MEFEISNIGIVAAITAGAISFLSPCVLPLVPGYVSFGAVELTRCAGERAR
jgi:cytochrome c-type biogenesis protein